MGGHFMQELVNATHLDLRTTRCAARAGVTSERATSPSAVARFDRSIDLMLTAAAAAFGLHLGIFLLLA
jgi:hypothetical protein